MLTTVGDHVEAEPVAVEGDRAVEVGDAQMDVADADGGMDGLVMAPSVHRRASAVIGGFT